MDRPVSAARVVVAHPGHLRLVFRSKRKHDCIDAEKLAKLLALDPVPCQDQSGGPHRRGRITRDGAPVVRKLVMEAAWQGLRHSPTIRAYFDRIVAGGSTKSDKDRRKIALVATAHDLVRVM